MSMAGTPDRRDRGLRLFLALFGCMAVALLLRQNKGTQAVQVGRLVLVALLFAAAVFDPRWRLVARLRAFLWEPRTARHLALCRFLFFGWLAVGLGTSQVVASMRLPEVLRTAPDGVGWLFSLAPPTLRVVTSLVVAFRVCCVLAALGLLTRVFAPLAAALSLYLFAQPESVGKVCHGHHALFGVLALMRPDGPLCGAERSPFVPAGEQRPTEPCDDDRITQRQLLSASGSRAP